MKTRMLKIARTLLNCVTPVVLPALMSSSALASIAVFQYNIDGQYKGDYVLYSYDQRSAMEVRVNRNLCPDDVKSIIDINPGDCLENEELFAQANINSFKDALFFGVFENIIGYQNNPYLELGTTMEEITSAVAALLPEYAPAAAARLANDKQMRMIFDVEKSVNQVEKALQSRATLNFIDSDPFLNLSGKIRPINQRLIISAFEKVARR